MCQDERNEHIMFGYAGTLRPIRTSESPLCKKRLEGSSTRSTVTVRAGGRGYPGGWALCGGRARRRILAGLLSTSRQTTLSAPSRHPERAGHAMASWLLRAAPSILYKGSQSKDCVSRLQEWASNAEFLATGFSGPSLPTLRPELGKKQLIPTREAATKAK